MIDTLIAELDYRRSLISELNYNIQIDNIKLELNYTKFYITNSNRFFEKFFV